MIDKRTETQISRYVLGTLPAGEARELEAALRTDPKLRLLVKELRGTAGSQAATLPRIGSPPGPEPPAPAVTEERPSTASAADMADASWTGWMPWALAACFAILCVVLVSIGRSLREQAVGLRRQLEEQSLHAGELQQQLEQFQSQADQQSTQHQTRLEEARKEFQQRLAEVQRQTAARTNQLHQEMAEARRQMTVYRHQADQLRAEKKTLEEALIAATASGRLANARIAVLRPTADGPAGALGACVWSPQEQRGLLVLEGLPPPPPRQVYQLWLSDAAFRTPVSGGVLQVGGDGRVRLQFAAPERVETAERFSVSAEAVGGVAAPAGKILMSGN